MNVRWRQWRASWRDTWLLLGEFRNPLLFFLAAILGGGGVYFTIATSVGEPVESLPEAVYLILTLAFLQPSGDFPRSPFLQIFYFAMPLIGIGTLAQGLADFGILLFNRRARSKEWEMAVASTLNKHHILVGLGHLGYRVIEQLHQMEQEAAVIERNPSADLTSSVQKMGIPVIQDDASREAALVAAGVRRAKSIILCTQNDTLNLKIALKARSLNPKIQVIVRIFDDDFAQALHDQFGFNAMSATGIAAPAFASSAAGADITNPISVEGEALSLARLTIGPSARVSGMTVGQVEDGYDVSIILVRHDNNSDMHPTDSLSLAGGDTLAVLGRPDKLNLLVHDSQ